MACLPLDRPPSSRLRFFFFLFSLFPGLIRFLPFTTNDEGAKHEHQAAEALIGEPVDPNVDVGLALYPTSDPSDGNGKEEGLLEAYVFSGTSILSPGHRLIDASTGQPRRVKVGRVLSPLAAHEVGGGAVRCIGLNVSPQASRAEPER